MHTNALIHESSPYLLQHAHNPVDWLPWGEPAFDKARRGNKPVFLSIGYSTCHWCHVMERESFEDPAIASLLNRHFVPIKVDREERPDVDRVYMTYVQATTGGGGWPMSVWLTPGLKPFFGGTYFPPDDRGGRPGFETVLLQVAEAWGKEQAAILASSDAVLIQLQAAIGKTAVGGHVTDHTLLERGFEQFQASYDPEEGGFGDAPKFPRPSVCDFMLRFHVRTLRQSSRLRAEATAGHAGQAGARDALGMVLFTLRKMALGGLHDHLGGGFHRYSVDARWHVPHFEKMLYDQGQLACTYLDAYQLTRDAFLAEAARGILDYVRRDMTGDQGQFHSAEDADSPRPENINENAEGAFYVWTRTELDEVLGTESAELFAFVYGVEPGGNVRDDPHGEFHNRNVLILSRTEAEAAAHFTVPEASIRDRLAAARRLLFETRNRRPRPHLDDKTLTAWNGLMISAFARAYQVLGDDAYITAARRASEFIRANLYDESRGVLLRRYRAGKAAIDGYADDYAFLIRGLLDLYETCFDVAYIEWALALQKQQDALFWDERGGGYFDTSGVDETILLRMKEGYDGAEPSANSVAALNLLRLAQMTDDAGLRDKAEQTLAAFGAVLRRTPHALPAMLTALAFYLNNPRQIVIAGRPDAKDTQALLAVVRERFAPNQVVLLADGGPGQNWLAQRLAFLRGLAPLDGKATAYVCDNCTCQAPVTTPAALREQLGA
jgi:uncharacterized protein YyaL (SSP411 family)